MRNVVQPGLRKFSRSGRSVSAKQPPESPEREPNAAWALGGLGLELTVTLGLGAGLGYWIDTRLDSLPWGILAGTGIGFAVVLWRMFRTLRGMSR